MIWINSTQFNSDYGKQRLIQSVRDSFLLGAGEVRERIKFLVIDSHPLRVVGWKGGHMKMEALWEVFTCKWLLSGRSGPPYACSVNGKWTCAYNLYWQVVRLFVKYVSLSTCFRGFLLLGSGRFVKRHSVSVWRSRDLRKAFAFLFHTKSNHTPAHLNRLDATGFAHFTTIGYFIRSTRQDRRKTIDTAVAGGVHLGCHRSARWELVLSDVKSQKWKPVHLISPWSLDNFYYIMIF